MKKTDFESLWNETGNVSENAPQWARVRMKMREAFPAYYAAGGADPFAQMVGQSIQMLDALKHQKDGPAYLGNDPSGPRYDKVTEAQLARQAASVADVVRQSVGLFQGLPNWNHPLAMPNVIPPANLAGILAAMMTEVFSPNLIEGEYAWNVEVSELESAAMVARLIGWDPDKAGGLFTFGGSGCYFYGLKYALTRVLGRESRFRGIRTDAKLLVSQQGHYCKLNSSDWTGLGMDNIIEIETDPQTNAMDLNHLESVMKQLNFLGTPIAAVVCTMGTTDAFALDPVTEVRQLIDKYPNPGGYGRAFLYCDAVIGWSWLTFGSYDFAANPLGFSSEVLAAVQDNYEAIKGVIHADAIGCDFHKVGWAPYNSSLFMVRDYAGFQELMRRPGSDYLQERTSYNPGLYTLEVSRSASYSMAAWATLKFLGHEGFQAILGGILELRYYLRHLLEESPELVCVNEEDHGFVTLFRVYPRGVDAAAQYEKELTDPAAKEALIRHNQLQEQVADKLWEWFRDGQRHDGSFAPCISYSSGFRPTTYNREEYDRQAMIYALKSFPMNLNIDPDAMQTLVRLVLLARDEVATVTTTPDSEPRQVQRKRLRVAVENLLSGVTRHHI
ncbi:MAG: pyridoxal-dependent decarboxylase [Candidatus Promineifilaceae bacterium]|nr:pyridoxal-dependent decarboxylase [Candidatus Promineifilaceae bacterium]